VLEINRLLARLPGRPLVSPPGIDAVAARAGRYRTQRQVRLASAALALVTVLGVVQLAGAEDREVDRLRTAGTPAGPDGSDVTLPPGLDELVNGSSTTTTTADVGGGSTTTSTTAQPGGGGGNGKPAPCPSGQNAGATDVGVTGDRITIVSRGPGLGVKAAAQRVNRQGGICGRRIDVQTNDSPSFPPAGDYFAMVPGVADTAASHEGLTTPVVGGEGWSHQEYGSGWSWPVGTSAAAQVRIMVTHAHESGAKTFGMVHDSGRPWGTQAADAFRAKVKALTGADPKAVVGLQPGKAGYTGEAQSFNEQCGCDFVAFAMLPDTALNYLASQSEGKGFGTMLTGTMTPLFNDRFARDCGPKCDRLHVWTPYNPPIGRFAGNPDVAAYVEDLRAITPTADATNQVIEREYVGARVLIAALERVGANLTRDRLRAELDALRFSSGLTSTLDWGPSVPADRFANRSAQAFRVRTASGSFAGFEEVGTGLRRDPS